MSNFIKNLKKLDKGVDALILVATMMLGIEVLFNAISTIATGSGFLEKAGADADQRCLKVRKYLQTLIWKAFRRNEGF